MFGIDFPGLASFSRMCGVSMIGTIVCFCGKGKRAAATGLMVSDILIPREGEVDEREFLEDLRKRGGTSVENLDFY